MLGELPGGSKGPLIGLITTQRIRMRRGLNSIPTPNILTEAASGCQQTGERVTPRPNASLQ